MRDKVSIKNYIQTVMDSNMSESGKLQLISKTVNEVYDLGYKEAQGKYIGILETWKRESTQYVQSLLDRLKGVKNGNEWKEEEVYPRNHGNFVND